MNLRTLQELRETVMRIGLISHAPTRNYEGRTRPSSDEDIGGKRPPGTDREHPDRTDEDELEAFQASYHRRTVGYFLRRIESCRTDEGLEALLREARSTLEAWKRSPPPMSGIELEHGSFLWKCAIADDPRTIAEVTRFYGVSRSTVNRYRSQYRGVRRTIWSSAA